MVEWLCILLRLKSQSARRASHYPAFMGNCPLLVARFQSYLTSRQSVPQTRFESYFLNGKIFLFGKESIYPFRKNHPLSEDTKLKSLLYMSLVLGALRNVSFNDDNHILKVFTEGSENFWSSLFFNSENLLSSIAVHAAAFTLPVREVSFTHS